MPSDPRRAALLELHRRQQIKKDIIAGLHDAQKAVVLDPATRVACCAGRRGGKTHADAAAITLALIDAGPEDWVAFAGPTQVIARELIEPALVEMNDKYNLGWTITRHPVLYITTKAGAKFRLFGLDSRGEIDKFRGKRWKLVVIDEAKDVSFLLRSLVLEVLEPAFVGVGGRLLITGTPGRVHSKEDMWYAICHQLEKGWSSHHFDLRINPWVKDPEAELAAIRDRNGWTRNVAIYLREYEGLWRNEGSERVYPYEQHADSIQGLPPHYDVETWTHVLSLDLGFSPDPCAWTVIASHPKERDVYVVHAEAHLEMVSEQAAALTAKLVERFKPSRVLGDGGGLGAPYLADFNRRYAETHKTWMHLADKVGKRDQIEVVGDAFRAGKLKLCLPQAQALAHQMENLMWKDAFREVANPTQPDDLCDSLRYGFVAHKAYYNQPEPAPLTDQEREVEERRARSKKALEKQKRGLLR